MEKLIKLIDEYELKWRNWKGWSWIESDKDVFLKQEYIIWKRYGFIKWLVYNDKLNYTFKKKFSPKWYLPWWDLFLIDNIIKELSVSDKPIDYLIAMLQ